eukprot:TRINITY_DN1021_c1_g1_i10.p1 TRINITY_DN1021_c1_g1~~TRINITY_DN1021_c1_g1_i10.p1  ORF type:complete len:302 (-),score=51.37 TRINITY_DN1021_c1_g1_i10:279-1184(-)
MTITTVLTAGFLLSAVGWMFYTGENTGLVRYFERGLTGVDRARVPAVPITITTGEIKLMWSTPLFTVNLYQTSLHEKINVQNFNQNLTQMVLDEWKVFLEKNPGTSKSGSDANSANERFFADQKASFESTGKTALDSYDHFQQLKSIFQIAASTFFVNIGQVDLNNLAQTHNIFCWATVQQNCMSHLPHTHPYQLVSGVYYSRVPEGAGAIIFEDPRGPLPPFENRIIYNPKEGDLIIFPSWLLHQVTPTQGDEERISFSCNIPGEWERSTDVSIGFPISMMGADTEPQQNQPPTQNTNQP